MQKLVTVVLCLTLVAAACSSNPATESSADEAPATTEIPDPSDSATDGPPGADPDAPRQVPPLILPNTAPGTDQAAQELLADLERFLTVEQRAAVPWPDLRNPDPLTVYRSAAAFQNWMTENNPTPSLVEAYTAPDSPERGWDLEMFDYLSGFDLRSTPAEPPYSMRVEDVVHPAATGITDALLAQVPEGSAAIVYWDSVGVSQNVLPNGDVFSVDAGWTDVGPWVAIMAPTDVGWQVWWDELTTPPPPGSRVDAGQPAPDPRRDV